MPLDHPYNLPPGGLWLAGSLHAHQDRIPLQAMVDQYAARGYGYLMVAGHNTHLTPQALAALNTQGITIIPGTEYTKGPHLLHAVHAWDADRNLRHVMPNIRKITDSAHALGEITVAAHPSWDTHFDHIPVSEMLACPSLTGIEIYNGLIRRLDGTAWAIDKWDSLLSHGNRLWAFADDDSFMTDDVNLGWNVTCCADRSIAAILDALRQGRFYPSTGGHIKSISVEGSHITIHAPNASRITASGRHGKNLATLPGPHATFDAAKFDTPYLRFTILHPDGKQAWTQPFWQP